MPITADNLSNFARTKLRSNFEVGDQYLLVENAEDFPANSRVVVYRGLGSNEIVYFIATYDTTSSNRLHLTGAVEGTTYKNVPAGAQVEIRFTAGMWNGLIDSVNTAQIVGGAQGVQGAQGYQGRQGTAGVNGVQGARGAQGYQGSRGYQGVQGNNGFQGSRGQQGAAGSQGVQGSQGRQGSQGVQGSTGATGTQGNQGFQGVTGSGAQGVQGNAGSQGNQGSQGSQGAAGAQGYQGYQGATGSGTQGAQGAAGAQGVQGQGTGGALIANILDFGGSGNGSTSNLTAFNNALTWLKSQLGTNGSYPVRGYIYFPSSANFYVMGGTWLIDTPHIWLKGDGPGSKLLTPFDSPGIVFGIRENELVYNNINFALDASYRPDAFGKLDTTVATTTGQKYCYRSWRNSSITYRHTPFDCGPITTNGNLGWEQNTEFTVDFAIENGNGGTFEAGYVGGVFMLGGYNVTNVISLQKGGSQGQFDLTFTAADGTNGNVTLTVGSATGVQKLAFYVNFATRTAKAYANGTQVTATTSGTFFSGSGATTMSANEYSPLIIGCTTQTTDNRAYGGSMSIAFLSSGYTAGSGSMVMNTVGGFGAMTTDRPVRFFVRRASDGAICAYRATAVSGNTITIAGVVPGYTDINFSTSDTVYIPAQTEWDFSLYGLLFSKSQRYADNGVGQPQVRADAGTLNDQYRYFNGSGNNQDTGAFGFIRFAENPTTNPTSRKVMAWGRGMNTFAGWLTQSGQYTVQGGILDNGLEKLKIQNFDWKNPTVVNGATLELQIKDCDIIGGNAAISTFPSVANYTTTIENCTLSGVDCNVSGAWSLMKIRNCKSMGNGKAFLKAWASSTDINNLLVAFPGATSEAICKSYSGLYGGQHRWIDIVVDFEGNTVTDSAFHCEQYPGYTIAPASQYTIDTVYLGTACNNPDVPIIKVIGLSSFDKNLVVTLDANNILVNNVTQKCTLQTNTKNVVGRIVAAYPQRDDSLPPCVNTSSHDNLMSPVIQNNFNVPFPRGTWYRGSHELQSNGCVAGQFQRWRCHKTGTYGTSNPPLWTPFDKLGLENDLGGVSFTNEYHTATLS